MAYKQTPGRGNSPKTGNGLPTPLKQQIETTDKYEAGKKKLAANRLKGANPGGLNINTATGEASVKPYEKKFVENKKTGQAHIVGGNNKTVASASKYGNDKAVKDLRQKFVSDSTDTMNRRNRNAQLYNATSGGTTPSNLSAGQVASLITLGKAKRAR